MCSACIPVGKSSEVTVWTLDPESRNAQDAVRSLGSTPSMVDPSVLPLPTQVPAVLGSGAFKCWASRSLFG